MGLFDATDVDWENEVEEFVPGVPKGTYEALVSNVETEDKDTGLYLVISYTVTDGPQTGKTHKEYQRIVQGRAETDKERQSQQFLKTRLVSLGIPANRIATVEPDDIVGAEVALTLVDQKNNPTYRNVQKVVLLGSESNVVVPTATKPKVAESKSATEGNLFD